ncbi:hypothetical protein ASPACDRAFT_36149 [Aspergillus aculeatus ATCC 16872]|uniref:Cytokinesis regulator (Byr4) n=1 Tax=Aspergillus aculeatus (strain ATCC 16872 / CBS 172.66 / WB 5094) TaxID=690307 RepID=A0A1L9WHI0_ASPA1|nr:uncharacterized protein ASPACDRAFT_36149 [Aspergillus aculeatus ATCC 16872]OJJ95567.1 hypothetical protein ASPACDRAFT_36149 [Aspergillus aculeatus ATCC 16872]
MAALTLELRSGDEESIECWDGDEDLQCYEEFQLRAASSATSVTNSSVRHSVHRDSISSRRSARSDLESNGGGDEDWQVQLLDNDEMITEEAIASAKHAGIPLPINVPKSALVGGTIKRLGRRKPNTNTVDDWADDVDFPGPDGILQLREPLDTSFPEALRQVSSAAVSPIKASASATWDTDISTRLQPALSIPAIPRMDDDTDDAHDIPTIKVARPRSPDRPSLVNNFMLHKDHCSGDDCEQDFELPNGDLPLRLTPRNASAGPLSPSTEEIELDWSEGSIGVRFGGATREHRSNPSSMSVVSPSASSCLTAESEDDGLDGLVIPEEPLDLESHFKKRGAPVDQDLACAKPPCVSQASNRSDDFFSELEIEDGLFDPQRLSINPNIKCKPENSRSPVRHSTTTLTFTNMTISPKSRIPRLSGPDRPHSTNLETVSESGAPLSQFRELQTLVGNHSAQYSVSSLPSVQQSSTSHRRHTSRMSKEPFASDGVPFGRCLASKRSMPTMRDAQHSATSPLGQCFSSYSDVSSSMSKSMYRPKTPVDCLGHDVKGLMRKAQVPFIPAGASEKQSHHASLKNHRQNRRNNLNSSNDSFLTSYAARSSRNGHDMFSRSHSESSPEALTTVTKRTITRPTRRRNFGDGSELALFDDLPTSTSAESRFVKHPSGRGVPRSFTNKLGRSPTVSPKTETISRSTSSNLAASLNFDNTPRFARDTNASRNAREQRIASLSSNSKLRESHPLAPLGSNARTSNISRMPSSSVASRGKKGKATALHVSRPHLIKPLGTGVQEAKSINGMRYNPKSFSWEGNESSVRAFETSAPKSPKPTPALITNIGAMQNVQVVGGMVFDPRRMCWLKLAPSQPGRDGLVAIQDEDDVFASLDDLKEGSGMVGGRSSTNHEDPCLAASGDDRSYGDSSDEWPITEEFDVGPEFIRRQRAEEEKWRRKVEKWTRLDCAKLGDGWRWAIRDLVRFNGTVNAPDVHHV